MKVLSIFIMQGVLCLSARAQTIDDSARQAVIKSSYQQALRYKNGSGGSIDYTKAVYYFNQAAQLGDEQSIYAVAYMQYKGLGCTQDYTSAASAFATGAFAGRVNSMYFYALCLRNGYGIVENEDSARYWLAKADSLGYKQATLELKMMAGENGNDSAKALVRQIKNAAIPDRMPLNKFTKVYNSSPSPGMMAGMYAGWLVQYDWSGQNGYRKYYGHFKRCILKI